MKTRRAEGQKEGLAVVGTSVQVSVMFPESFAASIMLKPFILDYVGRLETGHGSRL